MEQDKIRKIDAAMVEAIRFINAARAWREALLRVDKLGYHFSRSKEGGACKRASMDLTRSLAELRS